MLSIGFRCVLGHFRRFQVCVILRVGMRVVSEIRLCSLRGCTNGERLLYTSIHLYTFHTLTVKFFGFDFRNFQKKKNAKDERKESKERG